MPLRFCMVTTFFPPHHFGGDAMYVQRLAQALAEAGHEVTVVYPPDAYRVLGGRTEFAEPLHSEVRVRPLRSRLGGVDPTVTYLTGRPGLRRSQLREVLDDGDFDVVHFHNVSLVGGPGILSYGSGVKLYTAHEHWLVCPTHVLWKLNRELCERPTCLRCTLAYRRPPQLWRYTSLLERSARNVDVFLSPSRFSIRMHHERGFPFPMRHHPYFLPADASEPAVPHVRERPYFLVVGRLERLKGVQTLIEVFGRYAQADLLVVGDGTYGDELRQAAAGLRHVEFLGRRPFGELRSLYAGAIALIQPSIGYETFGLTVLEAFAQRTPAIVRDLGPLPEFIDDSGGGFAYRTDDELVDLLERLRLDPDLRNELGERGARAHRERWSEDAHLRAYFAAIDEVRERSAPTASPRR